MKKMSFIIDRKDLQSTENRKQLAEKILDYFDEAASTAEALQIDVYPLVSKTYYKTGEIAEAFQVSDRMVRKWCEQGKVAALRTPGGAWRIPVSQFPDLQKVRQFQETADQINVKFKNHPDIDEFER